MDLYTLRGFFIIIGILYCNVCECSGGSSTTLCVPVTEDNTTYSLKICGDNTTVCPRFIACDHGRKLNITLVLYKNRSHSFGSCGSCCRSTYIATKMKEINKLKDHIIQSCSVSNCTIPTWTRNDSWKAIIKYTCKLPSTTTTSTTRLTLTTSINTSIQWTATHALSTITPRATINHSATLLTSTTASTNVSWTTEEKEEPIRSDEERFPIATAVSIPMAIIVVGVIVLAAICVWRKRRHKHKKRNEVLTNTANDQTTMAITKRAMAITNRAYVDCYPDDDQAHSYTPNEQKLSASRDSGYTDIYESADEQNNDEYNTIDFNSSSHLPVDAGYGHLPKQTHTIDNTYAHIKGDQSALYADTTYSHIVSSSKEPALTTGHEVSRLPTTDWRELVTKGVSKADDDDAGDEYNHTNFARSAAKQEEAAEGYASLGNMIEATHGKPVILQAKSNHERSGEVRNKMKRGDEYVNVFSAATSGNVRNGIKEASETDDNSDYDSGNHYFVLQKEDSQTEEYADAGQHNYFVLEKEQY